jgi:hypothetical protein
VEKYGGFFIIMENRKGIWIPIEIIEDDNLDWLNKVLLSEIISYSKLPLGCIASNEKFGELLNIHRGNVSKRISYLVENEYIKIIVVNKSKNKSARTIIPHKDMSGNAQESKRIRTDNVADTHKGVSVNAQEGKRKRSSIKTPIISVKKTLIETDISSDNNTEKISPDEWIKNYLDK